MPVYGAGFSTLRACKDVVLELKKAIVRRHTNAAAVQTDLATVEQHWDVAGSPAGDIVSAQGEQPWFSRKNSNVPPTRLQLKLSRYTRSVTVL